MKINFSLESPKSRARRNLRKCLVVWGHVFKQLVQSYKDFGNTTRHSG